MEEEWNEDPITPHTTSFTMGHSPEIGLSNQSIGSQGTSSRAEEQVHVAKEQVQIAKQQVQIAERGLVILEQSRPRIYSENDVWIELENLGVMPELRMRCSGFYAEKIELKVNFLVFQLTYVLPHYMN
ncbi:hypothetical protein Ahy_B05g074867 [Arachis hypogaea]|uniref:Uncharacterized protein n=1 Tax=Arachis hypogaea TaxID=3818 RepID=A0A444Z008_ARAHY|nr:hypothetical protein Ahy_B05g074867 [Arachis hypogaea]